jgi:hypothetical protein
MKRVVEADGVGGLFCLTSRRPALKTSGKNVGETFELKSKKKGVFAREQRKTG